MTPHGAYCKTSLIEQGAKFDEKLYDMSDEEIKEYMNSNSENDIIYIKFSYKEIGRDEEWFRKQCRSLNNDVSKINREILLQWNRSTTLSPFLPEHIDRLRSFTGNKLSTVIIHSSYILNIYENIDWNRPLLIGGDFGGSATQDATALSIVDPLNMHCVADFSNNKADPITVADIIYELMTKYFPKAVFVPEQNGYSDTIISILLRTNIAERIYFEFKEKKTETKLEDGNKKIERIKVKSYGINTNTTSREKMMNIVFDIVENDYESVISPLVIDDIAGLERNKSGKIEHRYGGHDDSLFSYLMVRYVFSYGVNLARFGIYKPISSVTEDQAFRGARSDEEFVGNINTVLLANFNRNDNGSDLQREIIDEFYARQDRNRKYEEEKNQEYTNYKRDKVNAILRLNMD